MNKVKRWYYSDGRNDMPDGLNLIELTIDPLWSNGYKYEECEYIHKNQLGYTREDCLLKKVEKLNKLCLYYHSKLSKEEQEKHLVWQSCGNHLTEVILNESIKKCDVCNE